MKDPPAFNPEQLAELRRRCRLVLDLADVEVQTRYQCARDGVSGEQAMQEARDCEADVDSARPFITSLPAMLHLLNHAVTDWPQFDGDDHVPGANLVDWFGRWRQDAKALLAAIISPSEAPSQMALQDALEKGFAVLTHNAGHDPGSRYEAWAYEGPLDFDNAGPVCFGLGADPHEALDALNWQLQHNSDRPAD